MIQSTKQIDVKSAICIQAMMEARSLQPARIERKREGGQKWKNASFRNNQNDSIKSCYTKGLNSNDIGKRYQARRRARIVSRVVEKAR